MKLKPIRKPASFRNPNFMTPEALGYYSGVLRGKTVHVEISREDGPGHSNFARLFGARERLYGVSILRPDGSHLDPDPSKCCASRTEADDYLKGLGG